MTVYNLEYSLLDSINRSTKTKHVGIFSSLEEVDKAKREIMQRENERGVRFEVYPIDNLFERLTLS